MRMWLTLGLGSDVHPGRHYVKLMFYASETSYFQRALAHASYTAAPAVVWPESPAAEAVLQCGFSRPVSRRSPKRCGARSFKEARILIVDDEPANVELLRRLLERAGFSRLDSTSDPREAAGSSGRIGPTSSCWTCTCRIWTAWR